MVSTLIFNKTNGLSEYIRVKQLLEQEQI